MVWVLTLIITIILNITSSASTVTLSNSTSGAISSFEVTPGVQSEILFDYQIGDIISIIWRSPEIYYTGLNTYIDSGPSPQLNFYTCHDTTSCSIDGIIIFSADYNYSSGNTIVGSSSSYPNLQNPNSVEFQTSFFAENLLPLNINISSLTSRTENSWTVDGTWRPSPPFLGGYAPWIVTQNNYSGSEILNLNLIPEPSALSLLAVGLGVVLRRRRRTV